MFGFCLIAHFLGTASYDTIGKLLIEKVMRTPGVTVAQLTTGSK